MCIRDRFGVGHNDQAVSTHDLLHRAADSCFNIRADQAVLGQQIADDLSEMCIRDRLNQCLEAVADAKCQAVTLVQQTVDSIGHSGVAEERRNELGGAVRLIAAGKTARQHQNRCV